jgi:uncharacterized protein (DUF362 family)
LRSRVLVFKGNDTYITTKTALKNFSFSTLRGKRILLKPNAARIAYPGQAITTNPKVLEATIDYLREEGAKEILIGESCIFGIDSEKAFKVTGMEEISRKKGISLIDLDKTTPIELKIPKGKIINKIKVSSILKEIDFIISLPVMKTHMHTQVTLSIKNMKGLLWRREKVRLHQIGFDKISSQDFKSLDMAISDMAQVLYPDFSIIDGTTAMEGMGPAYGKRKDLGLIIVGDNALSTDAVASELMGFNPLDIAHLRLIAERGLGEIKTSNISILPEDYKKWQTHFEPPPSKLSFRFNDIIVHESGSCSACLATLFILLNNYQEKLQSYRLQDGKIHIGVGRCLKDLPNGTILIGNCTSKMEKSGILIQGCPPVSSQIVRSLKRKA